jgi:hypothetical protein
MTLCWNPTNIVAVQRKISAATAELAAYHLEHCQSMVHLPSTFTIDQWIISQFS